MHNDCQWCLDYNVNIGITHVFSCINICQAPRKLFEHESIRPCADPGIFGRGVQVSLTKKSSDKVLVEEPGFKNVKN